MHGLHGFPPAGLAGDLDGAIQISPQAPGSTPLDDLAPASLDRLTLLAPPGALERQAVLAQALRALMPGAPFTILAPKDRGGARLARELMALGAVAADTPRRHHRILTGVRPPPSPALDAALDAAIAAGAARPVAGLDLWSRPGLFSWDRPDPGTALLARLLPPMTGAGADLGCGPGALSRAVLAKGGGVTRLTGVDIDVRATRLAARNVTDPRFDTLWADATRLELPTPLDFVVMNPPFHEPGGAENRALGQAFVTSAARLLRRGGVLWLVANRHMPYETVLAATFATMAIRADEAGFKLIEARA